MPDRDAALAALRAALRRISGNPAAVLDPEAVRAASDLEEVIDSVDDVDAAAALTSYYWSACLILGRQGGRADYGALLRFAVPVHTADPGLLPEELSVLLSSDPALTPLVTWTSEALDQQGGQLVIAYKRTGQLDYLVTAADYFRAAAARAGGSHERLTRLNNLGVCLRDLYARTKKRSLLTEAITVEREAVRLARGRPGFGQRVNALDHVLGLRAQLIGDHDEPIRAVRAALDSISRSHPARAEVLSCLAGALRRKYTATTDPSILPEMVAAMRETAGITPAESPLRANHLWNLVTVLQTQYEQSRRPEHLADVVDAEREALSAASPADRKRRVGAFGASLLALYEETRRAELLEEAEPIAQEAVDAAPPGQPNRVKDLNLLGMVLEYRYAETHDIRYAEEAVDAVREAVGCEGLDPPAREAILTFFIITLRVLYEQTDRLDILEELVEAMSEALAASSASPPSAASDWDELNALLQMVYERTTRVSALEQAIRAARQSVAATPDRAPERASRLTNLGGALIRLYARTDRPDLLDDAVATERAAVAAAPPGHPSRVLCLHNLASALLRVFDRTPDESVLNEATGYLQEAVDRSGSVEPELRAMCLTALGGALRFRYELAGEVDLLREMIQHERDALAITPADSRRYPMILNNLAGAYQTLYERTMQRQVLEAAADLARKARDATPAGSSARASRLLNLSVILRRLYEQTEQPEQMSDLHEAVQCAREARTLIPEDHPDYVRVLSVLAGSLQDGFANAVSSVSVEDAALFENPIQGAMMRLLGSMSFLGPEVLQEAIDLQREAVRLTPDDNPERGRYLLNLGAALFTQAGHDTTTDGRRDGLRNDARGYFMAAGDNRAAPTLVRIEGYRRAARLSDNPGQAREGLAAIEKAIELIETLAPGSLTHGDRSYQIGRIADLPADAAATALAAGFPDRAVELLERLRGLLAADTLELRGQEIDRLRQAHPDLAARVGELRVRFAALDRPSPMPASQFWAAERLEPVRDAERQLATERGAVHAEWKSLLEQIRVLAGFADFLRGSRADELARQAQHGPVVYIVASEQRCAALVLTSSRPVQEVRLDDQLTYSDAYRHAGNLSANLRIIADTTTTDPQRRISAQRNVSEILAWLWRSVASPVLRHLGYTRTPGDNEAWPRIWWCPVGPLAFLPLHAAEAGAGSQDSVLNRVVSSYTTTVRALTQARTDRPAADGTTVLVVPGPDLPDGAPSSVSDEIQAVISSVPDARVLESPTRAEALGALPNHPVVHFACHGDVNQADPARSQLILADNAEAPLTVADISALDLSGTLSYLSACDTSVTSPQLADESLHITGAFQVAGYKHVIGTLWKIDGSFAAKITAAFYREITKDRMTSPDPDHSAVAVHRVVRTLREDFNITPTIWAGHVHVGPLQFESVRSGCPGLPGHRHATRTWAAWTSCAGPSGNARTAAPAWSRS